MRGSVEVPLSGQPNAGQPRTVEGRNLYLASPDYLVAWARRAVRQGATLLGGCCGTTPDHIRALRQAVAEAAPSTPAAAVARPADVSPAAEPVATEEKSRLARSLHEGRFVTGVEVPLPTGWATVEVVEAATRLAAAGVDFLSLPEGSRTEASMPPIALGHAIRDIEPVIHYSCRNRRLRRIQSDLLGACANGIRNLLVVTGAPSNPGVDARADLDVDAIGAVNLTSRLNHGEDIGGNPIGVPTRFHVGVRLDPTAFDREREIARFQWKVDAGAEYAVTSPIFDVDALESLLDAGAGSRIPILATVWPLQSAREAEFFEQEMADVPVPAAIVERMRGAEAKGGEREEGIAIARELAEALRPLVAGLQVVAPDSLAETALAVL